MLLACKGLSAAQNHAHWPSCAAPSDCTQALPSLMFTAAGAFQMWQWAVGKHVRLRKVSACQ